MCYKETKTLDGLVGHEILSQRAINNYYLNPNFCKQCNKVIKVKCGDSPNYSRSKSFCDKKCSSKHNYNTNRSLLNYTQNKILKKYYCKECNKETSNRRKYCQPCFDKRFPSENDIILKDIIYKNHNRAAAFALVRDRAKVKLRKHEEQVCKKCGYDKHVECCHIKSISSFDEDTTLDVVNHLDNLLWLCPNHHWELDFGELNIEDIIMEDLEA